MSRTLSWLVTIALWIAAAQPLDAQRYGLAAARRSDFDIRDLSPSTEAERSARRQSGELVARRRAGLESFARAAGGSIRLAPNRHGLPKTYSRDGRALTAPANGAPEDIARTFLRANRILIPFSIAEIDRLRLTGKDVSGRAVFLAFNQTLDGVDVYNGQIKVTMTADGEVVHAGVDDIVPRLTLTNTQRLTAEQAIGEAFETLGLARPSLARASGDGVKARFRNPRGERFSPITAELTIFPMTAETGRLAHRLSIEADGESWHEILIDAEDGRLLLRHNLYSYAAQARVWLESPMAAARQLVTFPDGWIPVTGRATTGNNADTYLDTNGDDRPDSNDSGGLSGGRASSAEQMFDFPFGDGLGSANPRGFQAAAVTNAFYLVNKAHDFYYALGFTEAAGNFQFDNFGRGGSANDPVLAEVQHSSMTNNASFATPADGTSPRMRLGLFTRGTSSQNDDLDSAFDGGVVFHEYTHGVSNRLVGARTATTCLSGVQSRAMGEGWSDYFASSFYGNPVHGAYLTQNPAHGTRRFAYNNYPYTYEDLGIEGFEVHDDGEIWAAALWDLRSALGQEVADSLVLNGLKVTPCRPSMIDARDAILAADKAANGGANRARIWQVFARRGLGFSAAGLDGGLYPGIYFNAAFDQPTDLQPGGNPAIVGAPPTALPRAGDAYTYAISATNPAGGTLSFALTQGPDGMTVDGNGVVRWTAGFTQQRVKVTVSDGRGGKVVHGFVVTPETPLAAGEAVSLAGQRGSIGYANVTVPVDAPILQVALREGSGDADLDIFDPDGLSYWSERDGNVETLSIATPKPGRWRIAISAFRTYASLSLMASIVTPAPIAVNSSVSDLSGVQGGETFFRFTVPTGASALKITTSGGTGDVDLYLRSGRPVACQVSSVVFEPCARDMLWSEEESNEESIQVTSPAAGDWYVSLSGYEEFRGVTLRVEVTLPDARPTISVAPASLVFIQPTGGAAPAPQSFTLAMAGGTASWTASASSAGNWLAVSPAAGTGAATIQVNVSAGSLPTGAYSGTITIAAADADGSPLTINVALTVGTIAPAISAGGIIGAAGTQPPVTTISPGGLASIFGSGFAPAGTAHAVQGSDLSGGRLPTRLAGACVEVEGRRAFLTFVSPRQINFQVPAVSLNTQVEARVLVNCGAAEETRSAPASVGTAAAAPEFLYWTKNADGRSPVVAVNAATGAYVGRPGLIAGVTFTQARPGDVLTVYGVSFGPTTPSFEPGVPPSGIGNTVNRPSVSLGSVTLAPEDVLYAGVSPGIAGLYQLNIRVPATAADGDQALVLNLGSFRTPEVGLLSVRRAESTAVLAVRPSALLFQTPTGQNPALDVVSIVNEGGGTLSWNATVTGGQAWLRLGSASGTAPAGLHVSVESATLPAGGYAGSIRIDAPGAANSPLTIAVTLSVGAPRIAVSPVTLSFQTTPGQDPPPQSLSISNPGAGTLAWNADVITNQGGSWLRVTPAGGSGNGTVQVSVTAAGLAAGTYNGSVRLSAITNSPVLVPVTLTVSGAAAIGAFRISTIAGTGSSLLSGDGGPAVSAGLGGLVAGLTFDSSGSLFTAHWTNNRIRRISATGGIAAVAGGLEGFAGDGGPASAARFYWPHGVALNAAGELFIADTYNHRIRRIGLDGRITTVVGDGVGGFSGDGGPASAARIDHPYDVAFDALGNLLISDSYNFRIRKVDRNGVITTVARLSHLPDGIAVDSSGNIYAASGTGDVVLKVTAAGAESVFAGTGIAGFAGDGGPAAAARLSWPTGVAVDAAGNVYIADQNNNRIRQVSPLRLISTVAGTGREGFGGDSGPAIAADLNQPERLAIGPDGSLYVSDSFNYRIRKLTRQ